MKYRITDIAGIVEGDIYTHRPDALIEYLLIDSRKIAFPAASLFFALTGPRRNGHQFIGEVYRQGVLNFIVEKELLPASKAAYPEANFIVVHGVLQALQTLAAWHRNQFSIPVIGITGSNGKTIVKEWLNQLLEEKFRIIRSPASYNSQIGVPLSVWQMNGQDELALFEAGISKSGEMTKLQAIIRPTIGILTNLGEAHSAGFANGEQKLQEKLLLFTQAAILIYPTDNPLVEKEVRIFKQGLQETGSHLQLFGWGAAPGATLHILSVSKWMQTTFVSALYQGREASLLIPFTDEASIENAITCWCALLHLELEAGYIREQVSQLSPIAMRLELKKGINNCSVINDSYSADLSSLQIALDFLAQQQQHVKKTVILSDILQSDRSKADLYTTVAGYLQQRGINRLIAIGKHISGHRSLFAGIEQAIFYDEVDDFLKDFYKIRFDDETILLKGARVFQFEQISHLLELKIHQTVLEINQSALVHNLKQYQQLLKPETKLMAMVKAFSYGSGSYEIANLLQFYQVDYLAVAYADEGIELREGGITLPIMVMNPEEDSFEAIVHYKLEPDIYSLQLFHSFRLFLKQKRLVDFPVHLEIETGMNRLGFALPEISTLVEQLPDSFFRVKSVFSHLAASEDPEQDEFTRQQGAHFMQACNQLEKALRYPFIRHIANSAAIARHPELQLDMVRLGIGLYGIDSAAGSRLDLREVSSLVTTIAQIKYIAAGESVGYGRRWRAGQDSVIATVRLGYADGYSRRLGNGAGKMLVRGQLAPVIGSVCMDMTMIDITGIKAVEPEDEVIVFGKGLPVTEVANWAGTIPYEIMTGVSQRVKRVYFEES